MHLSCRGNILKWYFIDYCRKRDLPSILVWKNCFELNKGAKVFYLNYCSNKARRISSWRQGKTFKFQLKVEGDDVLPDCIVLLYPHTWLYIDQGRRKGSVQDTAMWAGRVVCGVTLRLSLYPGTAVQSSKNSTSTSGTSSHLQPTVTTATITTDHHLDRAGLCSKLHFESFHRDQLMDVFLLKTLQTLLSVLTELN